MNFLGWLILNNLVPDVVMSTGVVNPRDRLHPGVKRVGIMALDRVMVGGFNLVQRPGGRSWVNDIAIEPERRGQKLALAAYLGLIAELQGVGRVLESDPGGLSKDSLGLWGSLSRRGVARELQGMVDQHGNPRLVAISQS